MPTPPHPGTTPIAATPTPDPFLNAIWYTLQQPTPYLLALGFVGLYIGAIGVGKAIEKLAEPPHVGEQTWTTAISQMILGATASYFGLYGAWVSLCWTG